MPAEFLQFILNPAFICLVVGVILVAVEIFVPGFGIFGISGLILILVGIVLGAGSLLSGLLLTLGILAILAVLVVIAMRSASKGRIYRSPLVLKDELNASSGFSGVEDMDYFLNRRGVAVTALRPSGLADFEGVKLDVVADSTFIEKDAPVVVIAVEGRRIVVRRVDE